MNTKTTAGICMALVALAIGASRAGAAAKEPPPETPLTEAGKRLLARYTRMLAESRARVAKAVPLGKERDQALALIQAEIERNKPRRPEIDTDSDLGKARLTGSAMAGLLKELTAKPPEPEPEIDKNVKPVYLFLKASTAAARAQAREQGKSRILTEAISKRMEASQSLLAKLRPFLSSDKLDADLARGVVLLEATPRGLAEFGQQAKAHEQWVENLLADPDLMLEILLAGGAKGGKYGQAMRILAAIRKASPKADAGTLRRLALAISLEHATPITQRNPKARPDAPATVDPVKRYLHYEKAFLAGELDAGFADLTVWDYRMVVNGYEPDETLAWGRKMLRNYRPDHIATSDYRWRYVVAVRTEIRYGSQDNQYDKPELQFFQNILMNGGVCGRRAFFGRFLLRAFGIPTIARPQPGHASLAHWTPDGWVVCLGGGWGGGSVPGYKKDLNFLATTQARALGEPYMRVKRAHWIGDVLGEPRALGLHSDEPAFWNGVALYTQRQIIEDAQAKALAAVGEDIGEANESKVKEKVEAAAVPEADRTITVGAGGTITIPAVACSKPTHSTAKIRLVKSHPRVLPGMQLHYSRLGKPEEFEYTFDAPAAGKYTLRARVVTPSWKQHLHLTVNGAKPPIDIPLPFTVGMWDQTAPVEVSLVKGKNVLTFSRDHERLKGLTIKNFTLTPIK